MEEVKDGRHFQISKAISMDIKAALASWTLRKRHWHAANLKRGARHGLSSGQASLVARHRSPRPSSQ
jgi:hypothetical protein